MLHFFFQGIYPPHLGVPLAWKALLWFSSSTQSSTERHAYFLGLDKPGLAWDAGSQFAKPEADQTYLNPFQATAKTWSPWKWVAMSLLTIWGHSYNPAASYPAIHFLGQQLNINSKSVCHVVTRWGNLLNGFKEHSPIWKENAKVRGRHARCEEMGQKMFKPCQCSFNLALGVQEIFVMVWEESIPGGKRPLNHQRPFLLRLS